MRRYVYVFCPATCATVLSVDLTTRLTQAYVNLLQAADAADAKQLQLDREIEALMEEKQSEDLVASVNRKEAAKYKTKIDSFWPKIAKLFTLHVDLKTNQEVMDLPRLPSYDQVKSTLEISEPEDVAAVNTIRMAKTVLISFHTRGLVWCAGHPGIDLDRNFANYKDLDDYRRAIADHLMIDMSFDKKKRAALSLVEDDECPKKRTKTEDGSVVD